nr:4'-phosphopantetheinyl transferase [uncultured bacterium]
MAAAAELLSTDERDRAARFRFDHHRDRFVIAHGALRVILGRYLRGAPAAVELDVGASGKPFAPRTDLRFNLSHSGTEALVAVTAGRDVGCDIEEISERVPIDRLAARFFSLADQAALAAFQADDRRAAFFRCWTRKEAYVKAVGDGLSLALDRFDVTVTGPATLLATRPDASEAGRWAMVDVPCPSGYAGAVCVARLDADELTPDARWWTLA